MAVSAAPSPPDASAAVARSIAANRMQQVFKGLLENDHSRDVHKRNLKAVLGAVTEVIRDQSVAGAAPAGEAGPTQYFAALMTVLESADMGRGPTPIIARRTDSRIIRNLIHSFKSSCRTPTDTSLP